MKVSYEYLTGKGIFNGERFCMSYREITLDLNRYQIMLHPCCVYQDFTERTTGAFLIIVCRVIAKSQQLPLLVERLNFGYTPSSI